MILKNYYHLKIKIEFISSALIIYCEENTNTYLSIVMPQKPFTKDYIEKEF